MFEYSNSEIQRLENEKKNLRSTIDNFTKEIDNLKQLNVQGQQYIESELPRFNSLIELAKHNYEILYNKLEQTIKEKDKIIEELKSDLLEFKEITDKIEIHDRTLKGYYDQRFLYKNDRDKLNVISKLIQLEKDEIQALYKPQSYLRAKLSESKYHFELSSQQILDLRRELDNTQDTLNIEQQKVLILNDKLVYGFDTLLEQDKHSQLLNQSTSKYKILQQYLDEKKMYV